MKKKITIMLSFTLIMIGFSPLISSNTTNENISFLWTDDTDDDFTISLTQSKEIIRLKLEIYDFDQISHKINQDEYVSINIGEESQIIKKGYPDLPNICRSVIIPNDAHMKINIIDYNFQEISPMNIAPSKGDIIRPETPETTPFTFSEIYNKNVWYPNQIATLRDPYILRDFRGQNVVFQPFQYNPQLKTLRIYTSITLELISDGPGIINVLDETESMPRVSRSYERIYEEHFLNFGNLMYTLIPEEGNMLIITYDNFYDEMLPFVNWKNMKGVPTEMVNFSEIGTTANDIDNYIDTYYHTNNLTFVLLVGDIDQIPSLYYSSHASDPSYSYIVGGDNYQDIFIGRFSAQTEAQVMTQVERSIEYERYPQAGETWYSNATGIGSPEGTGDDNEYDWQHIRNIRNLLYTFTYTWVDEFYGGSQGEDDDPGEPVTANVVSALNDGRSFLNHCGHGAWDGIGWGAMPGWYVLHNNDIDGLTNDNKLPFVILVACNSGEFEHYNSCFAETWMRATNSGEPTGAIGVFASTQSQSWSPPMEAQDEITDLIVAETYYSMGAITYSGTMSMMDEYGSSCYDETNTWTLFGDPSLQIRTDTPTTMSVSHDPTMTPGQTEFGVTVNGIEDALCAISYNGTLLGYNYTDSAGNALINFSQPIGDIDALDLVVTSFNKNPYITVLNVTPALRNIAEFEPMQGVLIRYPFGISYEIIAEISENDTVVTIVANSAEQTYVESQYALNGVNTSNCEYLIAPSDTYWTRDYGPWFCYNATTNKIEVVDFEYNRPRPNDDNIPIVFANQYGLHSVYMDIISAGGNYMTDGYGISVSTDLILTENPSKTVDQIKAMFNEYLGIETYHLYPDPLGEYIQHIDCWGKFLSPDTIMMIEVSPSHSNYATIEAAADYFSNQISCYGTPYNVVRVYCHLQEPYVNSLIINNKVLVPITGSSYDSQAIAAYEAALPGYEVLGFTGTWQNTDALHCRAIGIPDFDMIRINHELILDQIPNDSGFLVSAEMIAYNYTTINSPQVHWKNNSGLWNSVSMTGNGTNYSAYIPDHPSGQTIHYYISAENADEDVFYEPFIGSGDPHYFNVTLVPDIWVNPASFYVAEIADTIVYQILTVGNDELAGKQLNITLSVSDHGGGWLSINESSGSIAPNASMPVLLTIDTSGLLVGSYTDHVVINSDDPDEPLISIPVYLTIILGHDVGASAVNEPSGVVPQGQYTINATISNYGMINQTNVLVNCTITEGGIPGTIHLEKFFYNPNDWTITSTSGTAWEWDNVNYRMENSFSTTINSGYLDSPIINCSGEIGINLSYWHYWRADYGLGMQDGYVRGSIDGGATYPYLIDEFHHMFPGEETGIKTYDISWANNQENVRIRFDIYNNNDWYWFIDDFNISSTLAGNIIFTSETSVDVAGYQTQTCEFPDIWNVNTNGVYTIQIETLLAQDQNIANDHVFSFVEIFGDVSAPTVNYISAYPNPQIVDGFVNISCHVVDETVVDSVFVAITGPLGFVPVNVSMSRWEDSELYFYNTNYSIEGNYSYEIYANDTIGNGLVYSGFGFEIVNTSYMSVDVGFDVGWNLMTVPIENSWDASDLADNITDSLSVSKWDSVNQTYQTYIVGGPPVFDFPIVDGCGYFIDTSTSSVFTFVGLPMYLVNVPLKVGWNLLGWYHEYDTTASSLASNITGCLSVSMWDSVNQTYQTYIVGGPPVFDFNVECGMGIFVDVNVESTWLGQG
jgi:agmatine/peptidylarginine deiminase